MSAVTARTEGEGEAAKRCVEKSLVERGQLERSAELFREKVKTIQVFELQRPQKGASKRRLFGYP